MKLEIKHPSFTKYETGFNGQNQQETQLKLEVKFRKNDEKNSKNDIKYAINVKEERLWASTENMEPRQKLIKRLNV